MKRLELSARIIKEYGSGGQAVLAATIGKSPSWVSRVVNFKAEPTLAEKFLMADALNCNISDIEY